MSIRLALHALGLATSLLAAGCARAIASPRVRTGALIADIEVTAERAHAAELRATLTTERASGRRAVRLRGDDTLHVTAAGRARALRGGRKGSYRLTLPVDRGTFALSFARTVDVSAPASRGTLGPPFSLAPIAPTVQSRARSALTLTWFPRDEGAHVEVELTGACIEPAQRSLGLDPGALVVAAGALRARLGHEVARCEVRVTVRRTRLGDLDPALDQGGCFRLHQVRTTRFVSGP